MCISMHLESGKTNNFVLGRGCYETRQEARLQVSHEFMYASAMELQGRRKGSCSCELVLEILVVVASERMCSCWD